MTVLVASITAFINLLMRFFDVDGGCIRLDGRDIRDATCKSVRGAYAIGAVIMVVGYTFGRAFIYSTREYAILKLPFQIIMAVIGAAAAIILVYLLKLGKIKDHYLQ